MVADDPEVGDSIAAGDWTSADASLVMGGSAGGWDACGVGERTAARAAVVAASAVSGSGAGVTFAT